MEKIPDSVEIYYNLGLSYLRNGDIDEAILSFEKAIELKPDSVVVSNFPLLTTRQDWPA